MSQSQRKHTYATCPFSLTTSTSVNQLLPFLHQLSTYALSRGYQSIREFHDLLDVRLLDRCYVVQHCVYRQKKGWAVTTHDESVTRALMQWWRIEEKSHHWASKGSMTLFVPLTYRTRIKLPLIKRLYFFRALVSYHNPLTVANVLPFSVLDGRIHDRHSAIANKIHRRVVQSDWGLDLLAERQLMSMRISAKCNLHRQQTRAIHYWMVRQVIRCRVRKRLANKLESHRYECRWAPYLKRRRVLYL